MAKRYYWLKLKEDFFNQKEIKRLRKIAGGDTYTIIYLKLLLLSLKTEGKVYFEGIGDDFVDELSLEIDEDVENIKVTLSFLQTKGLLEIVSDSEYFMNSIPNLIGSETDAAVRKRRSRAKQEQLKLEQKQDTEEKLSDQSVTMSQTSHTDIDIELEKEKEKEKPSPSKYNFEEHHMKLALLLLKEIRKNNPSFKEPNLKSWANTFRLIMERDNREGKEIQDLILWTQRHEFWYKNILSAGKFRDQYDKLLIQMKDELKKKAGGNSATNQRQTETQGKYDFSKRRNL